MAKYPFETCRDQDFAKGISCTGSYFQGRFQIQIVETDIGIKISNFLEFEHAWDHFDQAQTKVTNGQKDNTALKTQAVILIRTPSQIEIRVFKNTRQPEGKLGIRLKTKAGANHMLCSWVFR